MNADALFQYVFKIANFVLAWSIVVVNITHYSRIVRASRATNEQLFYAMVFLSALVQGIVSGEQLVRLFENGPTMSGSILDDYGRTSLFLLLTTMLIGSIMRGRVWNKQ